MKMKMKLEKETKKSNYIVLAVLLGIFFFLVLRR